MYYRPQSVPPLDLRPLLQGPWEEAEDISLHFEDTGYSGKVYRLSARREDRVCELILKGVPDATPYHFYRDVLAPCRLHSPHMFGLHWQNGTLYVLMEFFPHQEVDWACPEKFRRAVDWLIYKDRTAQQNLATISRLDYIRPFDAGDITLRLRPIVLAGQEKLDPLFSPPFVRDLQRRSDRFQSLSAQIRLGRQTLTHNDYQMLNILFGTGPQQGELRVVDWTFPSVGSVFIDLATLVHVAPASLREELVERYRAELPLIWCQEAWRAAQAHVHLSILQWMVDALRSGQGHTVCREKMAELVHSLHQYAAMD